MGRCFVRGHHADRVPGLRPSVGGCQAWRLARLSAVGYKEHLCLLKRGEIINVKWLKPSFTFEFKEIQFVLKIDSIPSFPALTQLDVNRIL